MSRSDQPPAQPTDAFEALDADWSALCRRHRRTGIPDRWTAAEPDLASRHRLGDLTPAPNVDRTPIFAALVRLTRTGDTLAARALLQVLQPGLVRLNCSLDAGRFGGELGHDIVATAWTYIARLQDGSLVCHSADYLVRSIRRDVLADLSRRRRPTPPVPGPSDATWLGLRVSPTAEAEALSGSLARNTLDHAVAASTLTQTAADIVWLNSVDDQPLALVAEAAGTPLSSAYRIRNTAHHRLRRTLSHAA